MLAGPVLITGHRGLIGSALRAALTAGGVATIGLDLRGDGDERGDVRRRDDVARALAHCQGVVHLAAVSRVIVGERDPDECRATNLGGLRNVLDELGQRWLVFASSREVYGQATSLPATEDTPLAPINVYGRTKVEGEALVGQRGAVLRLSNVFGRRDDHADRVVPAFVRTALAGGALRVDGDDHVFDFTHIDDTVAALLAMIDRLRAGEPPPPPIHVVTGKPTTLRELAELAIELAGNARATIVAGARRTFDVARFWGDPARANQLLGWTPRVGLRDGLRELVRELKATET
jgi:nucleoside-diphosphate-sugar epimerase